MIALALELGTVFNSPAIYDCELKGNISYITAADVDTRNTADYEISGSLFTPTGGDPQFRIYTNGVVEAIRIGFSEPLESSLMMRIYYPDGNGNLSEAYSVRSDAAQGASYVYISIPNAKYEFVRFDIDGSFSLDGIGFSDAPLAKHEVTERPDFLRVLIFAAVFAAVFCLTLALGGFKKIGESFLRLAANISANKRKVLLFVLSLISGAALLTLIFSLFMGFGIRSFITAAAISFAICPFIFFNKYILKRIEVFFLVVCLCAGALLIFAAPKTCHLSWDDQIHYENALKVSYGSTVRYTAADYAVIDTNTVLSMNDNELTDFYDNLNSLYKGGTVAVKSCEFDQGDTAYLPLAAGLFIGRAAGLSFTATFTLARLLNLLFYAVICYFAIKKLKSGKLLLTAIALLTTCVFLATQYSYDSWLTALLMYGFACFFSALQQPEKKLRPLDCVLMTGAFFLAVLPKEVYAVLFLILLFMPDSRFKSKSDAWIYRICVCLVALLLFLITALPMLTGGLPGDVRGGSEVNSGAQLGYILSQPVSYAKTLIIFLADYLFVSGPRNYTSLLAYFGQAHVAVSSLLLIFFSAALDRKSCDRDLCRFTSKLVFFPVLFATVCVVATSLYIAFTPVGLAAINGCQPRYLLPLLFPALAVVGSSKLNYFSDKPLYKNIMMSASLVILFTGIIEKIVL